MFERRLLVVGVRDWFYRGVHAREQVASKVVSTASTSKVGEVSLSSHHRGLRDVFGGVTHARVVREVDTYDNLFPYVSVIAQHASVVEPYAVDKATGERLQVLPTPLRVLQSPNDMFSGMEFVNYLVTCLLVNPWVDVLVWGDEPGVVSGEDGVRGFTFLPGSSRVVRSDGGVEWHVDLPGFGWRVFDRSGVLSLSFGRHPSDLSVGVAPGLTVRKWASVDDLLADYERGFFGNSAVPAGMLEIVAGSVDEFLETKRELETHFGGAGRNNGVVYNFRPLDPFTLDAAGPSKLSWVPFSSSNAQLDLAGVSSVVGERLANALAVPDIVRGIDHGQTYANAQQAQRTFVESTLRPLLLRLWDKFGFELSRVCGGLSWRVGFDLVLPAQTDVERVRSESVSVFVDVLCRLVDRGVSVGDAVGALGLGDEWLRLGGLQASVSGSSNSSLNVASNASNVSNVSVSSVSLGVARFDAVDDWQAGLEEALLGVCDMVEAGEEVDVESVVAGLVAAWLVGVLLLWVEGGVQAVGEVCGVAGRADLVEGLVETVEGWHVSKEELVRSELEGYLKDSVSSFIVTIDGDVVRGREFAVWWARRFAVTLGELVFERGVFDGVGLVLSVLPGLGLVCEWVAHLDEATCEECLARHGMRVSWGSDWASSDGWPPIHPHCRCRVRFSVE